MRQKKHLLIVISLLGVFLFACKKEKEKKVYTPVPFLTGRLWIADTITINPPMTFAQLSASDQQAYRGANGWFKIAKLGLNDDGTVTQDGDYDFGYKTWRLVNNNLDIEMSKTNGTKQVLKNWVADATHFSYTYQQLNFSPTATLDCTLAYK